MSLAFCAIQMKLILAQKIIEYLIDLIIVIIIIIFFRNWDIWRHEFSVSIAFIYQKPNWAWGALKKECSIFCVSLCWRCSFDSFMEEWSWICVYVGGNLLLWFVLLIDALLIESSFFQHLLTGDGYILALYSHAIYVYF